MAGHCRPRCWPAQCGDCLQRYIHVELPTFPHPDSAGCEPGFEISRSSSSKEDLTTPAFYALPSPGMPESGDDHDPEDFGDANRFPVPPHRGKHLHRVRQNFWALLKRHKRGHAVFITLTFRDEGDGRPDSQDAARRLRDAEPVLDHVFAEWMLHLEFDPDSGSPHFHGIGIARKPVSTGWHRQPTQEIRRLQQVTRRERRPLTAEEKIRIHAWQKVITPNPHLREIWRVLREKLPAYGFGSAVPAQATPLEDAKRALSYILKDAQRSAKDHESAGRACPRYRRGTRLFFHSASFKVVCTTDFIWNNRKTRRDRLRKSRIAAVLRVSPEKCMELFGRKWNLRMNRLIGELHRTHPNWDTGTDDEIESLVIQTLASLPPVSPRALNPDAGATSQPTAAPSWAREMARTLEERRDRSRRGLPRDLDPSPVPSVLHDLEEAAKHRPWRA